MNRQIISDDGILPDRKSGYTRFFCFLRDGDIVYRAFEGPIAVKVSKK